MTIVNATNARKELYTLIARVNESSEPITIVNNKGKSAVLLSESDWQSIQETIYLNSIPGLTESVIEGGKEDLKNCELYDEDEEW